MKKTILLLTTLLSTTLFAQFNSNISEITPEVKDRMIEGNSWREGCPVALKDLRYLQMSYLDFDAKVQMGEMIVHKDISNDVIYIFEELFEKNYAINKIELVSNYKGKDFDSIEADNTSAFNCRPVTGKKKKWSQHAYGKAIDINPIENPYVSKTGYIAHKASLKYRRREHKDIHNLADRALLLKKDIATKIFLDHGWQWGGDWKSIKDYQHFVKR